MNSPAAPAAQHVDRTVLERLRRLGGEPLLAGMIDLFLEHTPARLAALREGAAAAAHDGVRRAAHSMKSTAGNLGAAALQALAERVERLAAAQDSAYNASIPVLEAEYDAVRRLLTTEREGLGT